MDLTEQSLSCGLQFSDLRDEITLILLGGAMTSLGFGHIATTFQAPFTIDLLHKSIMQRIELGPTFLDVFAEYAMPRNLVLLIYRHNRTMNMRRFLIQMDVEADNVVFSEVFCDEAIYVLCPFLNVLLTSQVRVVCTLGEVNNLIAEGEFKHSFPIATEDELRHSPAFTFDVGSVIRVFDTPGCQVLCQLLRYGL